MIARHHLMGAAAQGTALATFALFGTDQARKHLKQFDGSTHTKGAFPTMIARHHLMGAAAQGTALATFALFGTDQARKHLKQFDGSTAAAANNPMSTPQQWAYNLAQPIAERSIWPSR